jgi:predicted nucleic acid-binding protein
MKSNVGGLLLDTNVLIEFLRGNALAVAFVDRNAQRISISILTVAELLAGARGDDEQRRIEALAAALGEIEMSGQISRLAGEYRRFYGRSHGVDLIDASIAATAALNDLTLVTLNLKHFPMFPDLSPPF